MALRYCLDTPYLIIYKTFEKSRRFSPDSISLLGGAERASAFKQTYSDGTKWPRYIYKLADTADNDLECATMCNLEATCDYHSYYSSACYFGQYSVTTSAITGSFSSATTYVKLESNFYHNYIAGRAFAS